eukprot:TRINITY_DN1496_c0_g1_i2.p2 TRINITY_DN1496_c0_g1~~TRINITY_DN1496_c0_g1_i2.p2  ORF type:complete len:249 (-),score=49.21 TRINITY_DN1496_c0_g1_i2:496-1242(-)
MTLPAKSTADLQPLDKVVFAPLKKKIRTLISEPLSRGTIQDQRSKVDCILLVTEAYWTILTPELVKKAFAATGICPFNSDMMVQKLRQKNTAPTTSLSDQDLVELLKPQITQVGANYESRNGRYSIAGKVITSDVISQDMVDIQEARLQREDDKDARKRLRQEKQVNSANAIEEENRRIFETGMLPNGKKAPCCQTCGQVKRGHKDRWESLGLQCTSFRNEFDSQLWTTSPRWTKRSMHISRRHWMTL